jgi:transcription antitermination factor NusG
MDLIRETGTATTCAVRPAFAAAEFEPNWYAVYVLSNHEKRVAQQLEERSFEHLLPRYDSVRQWKDRRVLLRRPLFPGYVFVRLALRVRLQVLQIPGVVHLVGFGGHPAPVCESDIDAVRNCLEHGQGIEPYPYLQAGRRARVMSGPFQGLEGIILRRKNRIRFIVAIEMIRRSVAVEMEDANLLPVR